MMPNTFRKGFEEIRIQAISVYSTATQTTNSNGYAYNHVNESAFKTWTVRAKNLLALACGKDSIHLQAFIKGEETNGWETNHTIFLRLLSIYDAALADYNGGYCNKLRNLIQADIAGSEIEQAQELLRSGYTSAAAVVAGVILETTIKTLCDIHSIQHGKLDKMNADLVKAGQYNSLVSKRVTAMAAVRNSAAHGNTSEFSKNDVESMLADVERFAIEALT